MIYMFQQLWINGHHLNTLCPTKIVNLYITPSFLSLFQLWLREISQGKVVTLYYHNQTCGGWNNKECSFLIGC
jgi:hypothetical protein